MVVTPSTMVQLGTPAPDFSLPDTDGNTVRRSDFEGRPLLVVFMCNHCPYVKHIADALARAARTLQERGVAVVGINSNDADAHPEDAPDAMKAEKEHRGYTFPYCFDATQETARAFGAACTPDFFLYDAGHRLHYRGRFDAARPGSDEPVTGHELLAAAETLLSGQAAPEEQQPSIGCNIKWRE